MFNIVKFIKNKFTSTQIDNDTRFTRDKQDREEDGIESDTSNPPAKELNGEEESDTFQFDDCGLFGGVNPEERIERLKFLKLIKTARGIDAIKEAVAQGYKPLKYKVKTPKRMYVKEAIMKNSKTGKVKTMPYHFYEKLWGPSAGYDTVEIVTYDPYNFPPYAAYLLPSDLKKGETVILDDLIEYIVGASHNGHVISRINSAEAVWNGRKFIIDEDSYSRSIMMG